MKWESVTHCINCGSGNIDKNHEEEFWKCTECGCFGGGANFWK